MHNCTRMRNPYPGLVIDSLYVTTAAFFAFPC